MCAYILMCMMLCELACVTRVVYFAGSCLLAESLHIAMRWDHPECEKFSATLFSATTFIGFLIVPLFDSLAPQCDIVSPGRLRIFASFLALVKVYLVAHCKVMYMHAQWSAPKIFPHVYGTDTASRMP